MATDRDSPLGDLVVEIAKALLRTGYYSSDHPEARRSTGTLLAQLRQVVRAGELRLSALPRPGGGEVLVACDDGDDVPLAKVVSPSTAELYRPKLLEFMARRDLVVFAIRAHVDEAQLLAFLELMTRAPELAQREEAQRLDRELAERGVRAVTVLFRRDLLEGPRRLSWLASLLLSRLGKEAARPVPAGTTPAQLLALRTELLAGQLRPLRDPRVLAEILLHLELVPPLVGAGDAALGALPPTLRLSLGQHLQRELGRASAGALPPGTRALLVDVACGLLEPEVLEAGTALVGELLARGVLADALVPAAMRPAIEVRRRADSWTERLDENLAGVELDAARADEAGRVFGELVRRGRHADAARTAAALCAALSPAEAAPRLQAALDPTTVDELCVAFDRTGARDAAGRAALLALLAQAGEDGAAHVRSLLRGFRAATPALREELGRLGAQSVEAVLRAALSAEKVSRRMAECLLPLAARHPSVGLVPVLTRLTAHRAASVRRAAVAALVPLGRAVAEDALCGVLGDPDGATRRLALSALSSFGSRRMSVLGAMASTLLDRRLSPEARVAAAGALGQLPRSAVLPGNTSAEAVLVEALLQAPRGLLARLPSRHEPVHVAVCRALARVGSGASREALQAAADRGSPAVREAARAALGALHGRVRAGS